ncbi:Gfo/Idh/MocA family oxidoreductase [Actinomadura madurae]|uniref:Gfo/Idh/MocA family oxidoreductase n=1 Tax=Actinomadura madurae TaxID=1993 RepID=UPI0027E23F4C|nr:Gfo/Idh/MocA family oxidoreductase [Actinomadura madurae]
MRSSRSATPTGRASATTSTGSAAPCPASRPRSSARRSTSPTPSSSPPSTPPTPGYVLAALDAGKDVVVEKPLCTTAEDCAAILAAAERGAGRSWSRSTTATRRATAPSAG